MEEYIEILEGERVLTTLNNTYRVWSFQQTHKFVIGDVVEISVKVKLYLTGQLGLRNCYQLRSKSDVMYDNEHQN